MIRTANMAFTVEEEKREGTFCAGPEVQISSIHEACDSLTVRPLEEVFGILFWPFLTGTEPDTRFG